MENVPWLRLIPSIWQEVLDAVETPAFFAANDIRSKVHDIAVPIYHLGGWFDPFLRNTIDHYKGADGKGQSASYCGAVDTWWDDA